MSTRWSLPTPKAGARHPTGSRALPARSARSSRSDSSRSPQLICAGSRGRIWPQEVTFRPQSPDQSWSRQPPGSAQGSLRWSARSEKLGRVRIGAMNFWRREYFWPLVLIVVGLYFLLSNLQLLSWLHADVVWPLLLIALGVWLIVRRARP